MKRYDHIVTSCAFRSGHIVGVHSVHHKIGISQNFFRSIFALVKKIFWFELLIFGSWYFTHNTLSINYIFLHTVIRNSVIHFIFWYHGQIWKVVTFKWVIRHMLRGLLTHFAVYRFLNNANAKWVDFMKSFNNILFWNRKAI